MVLRAAASRPRLFWVAPALAALLASLTFIPVPREPFLLDEALSEKAVLNYAHEQGWRFGTDVVFTYGPWGYLTSRHFFPHQHGVQMAVVTSLSLLIAAGVCLLAWRLAIFWRTLLVGLFIYFSANIDPRADLLIYIGLLCWGWLSLVATGRTFVPCALCFAVIGVFGVMMKANFLVVAGLSAVIIACDLLLKQRPHVALGFILGLGSMFVVSWLLSGQTLTQFPAFFENSFSVIRGYDQVVGLDSPDTFKTRGLLVVILAVAALLIRALAAERSAEGLSVRACQWRTITITAWLGFLIFVMWKHGFVRADTYHMGLVFGFVPLLVLSLELLACPRSFGRLLSRLCGAGSCLVAVIALQSLFFSSFALTLAQPIAGLRENLSALLQPAAYENKLREPYDKARQAAQLPALREMIGRSTVDVFGQRQCYATLNDLNYHPRPVFQSYLAFNQRLMRLNEQFYLSQAAPKYVLFELLAADHKFPPLEDARALRHLLLNYEQVATAGPFLLLESKKPIPVTTKLLREGTARMNEKVSLPEGTNGFVWMEIFLEPNWLGQIRQVLFKPAKPRLAFWPLEGKRLLAKSGAPSPMLAAGFVASPLLLKTEDVREIFRGKAGTRPAACSVEMDLDAIRFWKPTYRFRIYSIESPGRINEEVIRPEQLRAWLQLSPPAVLRPARRIAAI